jgi:hypothetical protein
MKSEPRSDPEENGTQIDRILLKLRSYLMFTVSILGGMGLLVFGYFTDKDHSANPSPFLSFLALQFGGLLIFSAAYSVASDYFTKKSFDDMVRQGMDRIRLDQSIKIFGLSEVQQRFSSDGLTGCMDQSSSVVMVILRSSGFFQANYEKIVSRMEGENFSFTVVLPNPRNADLMNLLYRKFTDIKTPDQLADSIAAVIDHWLKEKIHDALGKDAQSRLKVYLTDKYPLYSAYTFDQRELWYIPYHYREDTQPIPVFVFRENFASAEIYKDLKALIAKSKAHDLSGTV